MGVGIDLQRTTVVISVDLIEAMGADNGVVYNPTDEEWKRLEAAIKTVLDNSPSFRFTSEVISDIAAGEEGERERKYGKLTGYRELSDVLDFMFNNSPQED